MPELPEVETIKTDLEKYILNKKITNIVVKKPKMIDGNYLSFKKFLINNRITKISRRGKLLIFHLTNNKYLLTHLKMTGQLIYKDKNKITPGGHEFPNINPEDLPNKYSHIIIYFKDESKLFFNDMRQFGYMKIVNQENLNKKIKEFGVEPLDKKWTVDYLTNILKNKNTSLKAVLLNQKHIAGLGNIYVDEACFLSKIKPDRVASSLTKEEIKKLHKACKDILLKAIKYRGTTFSSFRDSNGSPGNFSKFLNVYQKEGTVCKICEQDHIHRIKKVAGRSTHYCPYCQK